MWLFLMCSSTWNEEKSEIWDLRRKENLCSEQVAGDHLPRDRHGVLGSVFNIHRSIEGPYLRKVQLKSWIRYYCVCGLKSFCNMIHWPALWFLPGYSLCLCSGRTSAPKQSQGSWAFSNKLVAFLTWIVNFLLPIWGSEQSWTPTFNVTALVWKVLAQGILIAFPLHL